VLQRLYSQYLTSLPVGVRRDATLARSYYFGLRDGIIATNRKVLEDASAQGGKAYALVLVDKQTQVDARFRQEFPSAETCCFCKHA